MSPNISRGALCLALLVTVSVALCPDGMAWCQDPVKGVLCYNSTYTTCVLDSDQRSYTLCGIGLLSCGGICYHPNLNGCNQSSLISPTPVVTVITVGPPASTTQNLGSTTSTIMYQAPENDTQSSLSTTARVPVNTNVNIPAPNAGPGGAPPRYQPPASSTTSSTTSSSTTSTTKASTSPSTSPSSSTSSTTSQKAVSSTVNIPAPNAGVGGAPPRYVPPTITEAL